MVEQLGVRWPLAEGAEVARGRNQPRTEMVLPDAIDHDAGEERVVRGGDPAGEGQPAPRADLSGRPAVDAKAVLRVQRGRNPRLHFCGGHVVLSSVQHVMDRRFRVGLHHHRELLQRRG